MGCYNKFIKYSNLNEVSKFSNFDNFFLVSNIKSVSVWYSVDLSVEKSRFIYYSKGLLGIFLIYLITNKYPIIRSSKDQSILFIKSDLVSSDLTNFCEKFLIIYNSKHRKNITKKFQFEKNLVRFLITDLNFFTELTCFLPLFSLVRWLH